jgi:hypothetical protein
MDKVLLVRSRKSKFSIMSKIWLVAVVLAVVVWLGAAAHAGAASSSTVNNKLLLGELSLFNPFTLQSTNIRTAESGSGTEGDPGPIVLLGAGPTSRPPIRIPYRPPLRSPFRPPLP